jgi:glycosyltransferase involved in cell wall biosynthesis
LYPYQPNHESGTGGFVESFCITKFEAMAARCKIITRLNGALPERLPHCIKWDEKLDIVETLKNLDTLWNPKWTEKNYQVAINLTWESLAREWAIELTRKEGVKEEAIVAV